MKILQPQKIKWYSALFFSVFCAPLFPYAAFAADASLFLSPVTGIYTTGSTFFLFVRVNSGGESINAVEGKVEYDPKELEVASVDTSTSILGSWTIAPTFSNDTGELSFAGSMASSTVVARGEVFKVYFHALRSGEFHVRFASGAAVHAADGTGGNILTELNQGVYVIAPKENEPSSPTGEVPPATEGGEVLGAATGTPITSTTHPDQTRWYATSTAMFNWGIPAGTKNILLALDTHEKGEGTNSYPNTTHEKVIRDIKNGVWYFHLTTVLDDDSKSTEHYRVAVDTSMPTLANLSEKERKDPSDPNITIGYNASDTISGIDHYESVLDGETPSSWTDDGKHEHTFSTLPVGVHALTLFAVDKAGNRTPAHLEFTIENLPTPVLTITNATFIEGGKLGFTLTSLPNATVEVRIARGGASPSSEEFTLSSSGRGEFESAIPLAPGSYDISAVAHMKSGAISKESPSANFEVNSSFLGVMKRHPMIPIAFIALLALVGIGIVLWKRMMRTEREEMPPTEGVEEEEEEIIYRKPRVDTRTNNNPQRSAPLRSEGAVVLEKKQRPMMPATRL